MGVEAFIKLGDIAGESKVVNHVGEIDVLSWSWGISQTVAASPGGGAMGKARFSDITFIHGLDKASPLLMRACATGQHIADATLTLRKAGGGQPDYLVVRLKDVIVTGVQLSVGGEQPAESVSLQFSKVDFEYKPQKADGSFDSGVHFVYDIKANREG